MSGWYTEERLNVCYKANQLESELSQLHSLKECLHKSEIVMNHSEAIKNKKRDERGFDINSAKGRVESSLDYAKYNFAHVHLTNGYVGVYQVNGNLYIGDGPDREDQKKGKIFKGSICTDLWAGSVIDESTFIDILVSKGMTKANALKELKEQKKIWTNISVKVKPGKYKLSFCGDYEEFNKKFRKKNKSLKLASKYKPYFPLERIKD